MKKKLNLSLVVTDTSVQIVHNGKAVVKSIYIFLPNEIEAKKTHMQNRIDNYNCTGKL